MNPELIEKAMELFEKTGYIIVATADVVGVPHVATARKIEYDPAEGLLVAEWFCPGTLGNLQQNGKIALVVWDVSLDEGYQLLGEVVRIEDQAVLDGYFEPDEAEPIPQVERRLVVRVDKALRFSHAPHTDKEEQAERVVGY